TPHTHPFPTRRSSDLHLGYGLKPARPHQRDIDKVGRAQPQRPEYLVAAEPIKADPADLFDGRAEQDEVQIGIERFRPGRIFGFRSEEHTSELQSRFDL